MPWSAKSFRKHSRKARGRAGKAAAKAANSALKRGMSEGAAVRIGNFVAKRASRMGKGRGRRSSRA